jgi:hypothetical protein
MATVKTHEGQQAKRELPGFAGLYRLAVNLSDG